MKRSHFYLSNEQFLALKSAAEQQGVSLSRIIRAGLPSGDSVRQYLPDGQHSRERLEREMVERILANLQ